MKIKNNKGSITIYICIVLSGILLVTGVFTDGARIKLAHSQLQRASKTSLSSLLACYNNQLKDEYGLFGVYLDKDSMQESYEEYLSKNLNIYNEQNFLYDFIIENTDIEQLYNLENRDIFERQIVEFMKYRAPYEIAKDLINKLNGIKSIAGGSTAYKRKVETDSQAGIIGNLQQLLEAKAKKINEMGISSKLSELKTSFLSQDIKYRECLQKLSLLNKQYSIQNISDKDKLSEDIKNLQQIINSIDGSKQEVKNNAIDLVNQFKSLNIEAIESADTIIAKKKALSEKIKDELQYINNIEDGIQELKNSYKDDLSNMQKMIGEDNSEDIISSFRRNVEKCLSITSKASTDEAGFLEGLDNLQSEGINYLFSKSQSTISEDEDNRKKIEESAKAVFSKEESKSIDNNIIKLLPSKNIYSAESSEINWGNIDLDAESDATSILGNLSAKENKFQQVVPKVSEQLFVNEYIMGTFKHDVPVIEGESDNSAYNLRSEDKTKRDAFFTKYEVEYIINGNNDEDTNSLLTKSKIMPIRLVSNVIHIYGDPSKMSRITSLAASLSAVSSGLAAPIIQTMLVFSWATAESIYDINQLIKGERIPLFKAKSQWKTDISGAINKSKDTNAESSSLNLSYQDYLRIFLLLMDKDKKLARMQDLVQLNIGVSKQGFLLKDCSTMLKADAEASIKNLFISLPFGTRTGKKISRAYINEVFSIGY